MSTPEKPKPFLQLAGENSLIQQTLRRCQQPVFDRHAIIVASSVHQQLLATELSNCHASAQVILEPEGRDSCAAALAGAFLALQRDPQAVLMMLAADHHIPDAEAFATAVELAKPHAEAGDIVSFGIRPNTPATGYGYILPAHPLAIGEMAKIQRFAEKPDADTAQKFMASGYLWNSGNLLFSAAAFIAEATRLVPELVTAISDAVQNARQENHVWHLDCDAYHKVPQISVDYAILEKTDKVWVMAVDYDWSDIGTWDAVAQLHNTDGNGNACHGKALANGGRNNFVHAGDRLTVLSHVDDLIVVTTQDAVLVTRKGAGECLKHLMPLLAAATLFPENIPMDSSAISRAGQSLVNGESPVVERLALGARQSLQRQCPSGQCDHLVVVGGAATIDEADNFSIIKSGRSIMFEAEASYRIRNDHEETLQLIVIRTKTARQ